MYNYGFDMIHIVSVVPPAVSGGDTTSEDERARIATRALNLLSSSDGLPSQKVERQPRRRRPGKLLKKVLSHSIKKK